MSKLNKLGTTVAAAAMTVAGLAADAVNSPAQASERVTDKELCEMAIDKKSLKGIMTSQGYKFTSNGNKWTKVDCCRIEFEDSLKRHSFPELRGKEMKDMEGFYSEFKTSWKSCSQTQHEGGGVEPQEAPTGGKTAPSIGNGPGPGGTTSL